MFKKISIMLLFFIMAGIMANCLTVEEKYNTTSHFGISEESHRIGTRPVEVIADIGDKPIEATVTSSTTIWLLPGGEGNGTNFLRRLASAPLAIFGTIASIVPGAGKWAEDNIYKIASAIAGDQNLIELAKNKAINSAKADGIHVINISVEVENMIIQRNVKVTVRGRPITYKSLGPVSDARLNKITERIQDLRLTRMKTK